MRGMLLLLGLNFEVLVLIGAAIWIGNYLSVKYPGDLNWYLVTVTFAVVASIHAIWRAWRLISNEPGKKQ